MQNSNGLCEGGQNLQLKGKMGDTLRSPTISTQLQQIAEQAKQYPDRNIGWIVDADVSACFDNLSHSYVREIIKQRVNNI